MANLNSTRVNGTLNVTGNIYGENNKKMATEEYVEWALSTGGVQYLGTISYIDELKTKITASNEATISNPENKISKGDFFRFLDGTANGRTSLVGTADYSESSKTLHNGDILIYEGGDSISTDLIISGTPAKFNNEWKILDTSTEKDTWVQMKGATSTADGSSGYVPAPTSSNNTHFLCGNGSWVRILPSAGLASYSFSSNTFTFGLESKFSSSSTYGPTSTASSPAFGSSFTVPSFSVDTYGRITSATNTTITLPTPSVMLGATSTSNGLVGYVPAPSAGDQTKFLRGDATWQSPPATYLSISNISASGESRILTTTSSAGTSLKSVSVISSPYYASITNTGQIKASSFNAMSDSRLKNNFREYKTNKSILDLPIYKFDFNNGLKDQIGCKAQDLQEICPEIVNEGSDGYLSIQESKIVYLLIEEIKELKKEIEYLKEKL